MKRFVAQLIFVVLVFVPGAAWAQQQDDLEVTMKVLPADASASSALSVIKLPEASDRARDASAFGLSTAGKAREMKGDLGREFGQSVSEAAQQNRSQAPKGVGKGKAP